jgi:hypothetical protein
MARKLIPAWYSAIAFQRVSSGYPAQFGCGVYVQPQILHLYRWLPDRLYPSLI